MGGRTFGVLLLAFVTVVQSIHLLWTGRFVFDAAAVAKTAVVPAVQTIALMVAARSWVNGGIPGKDALVRFYGHCFVLFGTCALGTVASDVLIANRADLTASTVLTLLVTPVVQAALLSGHGSVVPGMREVRSRPGWSFAFPVLVIDALVLPAGWVFAHHSLIGMSALPLAQLRWLASKLLAAAVAFALFGIRDGGQAGSWQRQIALGAFATALAIVGMMAMWPSLHDVATALIAGPLSPSRPLVLVGLRVLGLFALIGFALAVRSGDSGHIPGVRAMIGAATIALFLTTLSVAMNGFLSVEPVAPWAALALTGGSIAASLFLSAGFLMVVREKP